MCVCVHLASVNSQRVCPIQLGIGVLSSCLAAQVCVYTFYTSVHMTKAHCTPTHTYLGFPQFPAMPNPTHLTLHTFLIVIPHHGWADSEVWSTLWYIHV